MSYFGDVSFGAPWNFAATHESRSANSSGAGTTALAPAVLVEKVKLALQQAAANYASR